MRLCALSLFSVISIFITANSITILVIWSHSFTLYPLIPSSILLDKSLPTSCQMTIKDGIWHFKGKPCFNLTRVFITATPTTSPCTHRLQNSTIIPEITSHKHERSCLPVPFRCHTFDHTCRSIGVAQYEELCYTSSRLQIGSLMPGYLLIRFAGKTARITAVSLTFYLK